MKNNTKDFIQLDLDELVASAEGLTPNAYQYYKGLQKNRIIINEDITENIIELATIPLMDMDADENVEHIEIILSTCGGSVYSGFTLVDAITNLKTKTTLKIIGIAASMGALIAIAGASNPNVTVTCNRHSVGLYHSGSLSLAGNAEAVKDTMKFNEKFDKKVEDFVLRNTNIDKRLYNKIKKQEFWMDAEDMVTYGFVNEIV